jgi:hypothetical protein
MINADKRYQETGLKDGWSIVAARPFAVSAVEHTVLVTRFYEFLRCPGGSPPVRPVPQRAPAAVRNRNVIVNAISVKAAVVPQLSSGAMHNYRAGRTPTQVAGPKRREISRYCGMLHSANTDNTLQTLWTLGLSRSLSVVAVSGWQRRLLPHSDNGLLLLLLGCLTRRSGQIGHRHCWDWMNDHSYGGRQGGGRRRQTGGTVGDGFCS